MNNLTEFRNWLADRDYWIRRDLAEQKAEELGIHFPDMHSITCKYDGDGNTVVPRRDLHNYSRVDD